MWSCVIFLGSSIGWFHFSYYQRAASIELKEHAPAPCSILLHHPSSLCCPAHRAGARWDWTNISVTPIEHVHLCLGSWRASFESQLKTPFVPCLPCPRQVGSGRFLSYLPNIYAAIPCFWISLIACFLYHGRLAVTASYWLLECVSYLGFSNECIRLAGTFTKCQCNIGYIIFGRDLGEICCMQQFWARFGE